MASFNLKVVTPQRVLFDGEVDRVIARTISGDIGILKGHANYVAPLSIGKLEILIGEEKKFAAISGGMIKVDKNSTAILTSACEWAEEIDIERAQRAMERAKLYIESPTELHTEEVAQIKLARALNRIEIAQKKD